MRWQWLTQSEKAALHQTRIRQWRRKFAYWPKYDLDSRTAFWLEHVWCRAVFHKTRNGMEEHMYPFRWEYRGGKEAPEVKTCPSYITPTKV